MEQVMKKLTDTYTITEDVTYDWSLQYEPTLDVRNGAEGDTVICLLSKTAHQADLFKGQQRINFVVSMPTKADLGWLLRGLYLNPCVRNLVIAGDDARLNGDALQRLWDAGVDEAGKLPDSGWQLYPAMDSESLDYLRQYVTLVDLRKQSLQDIENTVAGLPIKGPEMEARTFPPEVVAARATAPSRKTTIPMYSENIADGWLQLLNTTIRVGETKDSKEGERRAEILNAILTVDLDDHEESVGSNFEFSTTDFERYFRNTTVFDANEADPNGFGHRLQKQLEMVVEKLKISPESRTSTVLFEMPDLTAVDESRLPGITSITFNIVDGQLYASAVLHCSDIYNDFPIEALLLVRLQRQVAAQLGVAVACATFIIHNATVYEANWTQSLQKVEQHMDRPLPLKTDPAGCILFGMDSGKFRGMMISHDASAVLWEGEFDDPEDLSWYLLDTMPWLSNQHMRYIGQECAAMMWCKQEKICYMQG